MRERIIAGCHPGLVPGPTKPIPLILTEVSPLSSIPLQIEFPESLPVSGKRDEIMAALDQHQVIIVCGETGSGKTTQLPKIALAMGRGKLNYPPGRGKLIGHTQPRRIAASSVAKRIAEELKTTWAMLSASRCGFRTA